MPSHKTQKIGIERCVRRFAGLADKESAYRPIDMLLPQFDRKRFAVVGRPDENTEEPSPLDDVEAFNLTYLECAPGKGIGTHAHATPELFIPMSGRWRVTLGENAEQETILEPWDIISVPPDEMHGAVNISDETGWLMTVNAGFGGARIRWAANIVEELRTAGHDVATEEQPGEKPG